jgi:hypothetical protein
MQILQPTSLVTLVHIHQKEKIEVEIATKVASVNRSFDDSKCSHQFFQLIFEALTMTMSQSVFFYFFSVMKSCILFRNLTSNLLPSKSISFKSSAALELKKRQNSTYVFFSQGYTVVALNWKQPTLILYQTHLDRGRGRQTQSIHVLETAANFRAAKRLLTRLELRHINVFDVRVLDHNPPI